MNTKNNFNKKIILFILILIINFALINYSFAQNNSSNLGGESNFILITWEAKNFVPYNFNGKIMPTPGSPISISFEYIKNNKVVDLSKEEIYWYINGNLFSNTPGTKKINVVAPSQNFDVRVELPNVQIFKTIEIPVVKPLIVIDAPFPQRTVKSDYFEVNLLPYFFNIPNNDLDYFYSEWKINGNKAVANKENPLNLKIKLENKNLEKINISVFGANNLNSSESATKEINILIK